MSTLLSTFFNLLFMENSQTHKKKYKERKIRLGRKIDPKSGSRIVPPHTIIFEPLLTYSAVISARWQGCIVWSLPCSGGNHMVPTPLAEVSCVPRLSHSSVFICLATCPTFCPYGSHLSFFSRHKCIQVLNLTLTAHLYHVQGKL